MINYQEFANAIALTDNIICLVDDINETGTFGFTESIDKVHYNMQIFSELLRRTNYDKALAKSQKGLTTLFPVGRYIVIQKVAKDMSGMSMFFFDFRVEYSIIDMAFKDSFSDNVKNTFKKIKYDWEELFNEKLDKVVLSVNFQPNL